MFVRTQTNGSRTYLLIVDNEWVGGKVKQHVLLRLGRLDELLASGQLDSLIQSLGRFSEKLAVLGAHARGNSITTRSARIGPGLIFQRLWQACSIDKVLTALLQGRRFEFSVERITSLRWKSRSAARVTFFVARLPAWRARRFKPAASPCHRRYAHAEPAFSSAQVERKRVTRPFSKLQPAGNE